MMMMGLGLELEMVSVSVKTECQSLALLVPVLVPEPAAMLGFQATAKYRRYCLILLLRLTFRQQTRLL